MAECIFGPSIAGQHIMQIALHMLCIVWWLTYRYLCSAACMHARTHTHTFSFEVSRQSKQAMLIVLPCLSWCCSACLQQAESQSRLLFQLFSPLKRSIVVVSEGDNSESRATSPLTDVQALSLGSVSHCKSMLQSVHSWLWTHVGLFNEISPR